MNDSIWSVVAGIVKGFNVPFEYVLYDMSYENLIMYGSTLPSYHKDKGAKDGRPRKDDDIIKVDDPNNKMRVRQILDSFD